jgi:hypothetical protein
MSSSRSSLAALKRILWRALLRVKPAIVRIVQLVQRDELQELSRETQRLGSASAESVTHVGIELRSIDERLRRLEEDVSALRRLLEEGNAMAREPSTVRAGSPDPD